MISEKWSGFSEEDIRRIKSNSDICSERNDDDENIHSSQNSRSMKLDKFVKKPLYNSLNSISDSDIVEPLKGLFKSARCKEECTCDCSYESSSCDLQSTSKSVFSDKSEASEEGSIDSEENRDTSSILLPLEAFEQRQKRIEEENARRRALITKAITDKKKRTLAEASKLAKITEELNRLDSILSSDVHILRNYIEKASLEFSEAEKRYLKAEKEFVEAKLVLFEKMQRKEQLTEHLCAIIEQNENRKANKLVELMKQLEMEVVIEDDSDDIQPILPKLCMMNEEAYLSCQTLKSPTPKNSQTTENDDKRNENNTSSPSLSTESLVNDSVKEHALPDSEP